jgi:hypothetical protein
MLWTHTSAILELCITVDVNFPNLFKESGGFLEKVVDNPKSNMKAMSH